MLMFLKYRLLKVIKINCAALYGCSGFVNQIILAKDFNLRDKLLKVIKIFVLLYVLLKVIKVFSQNKVVAKSPVK